MTPLRSKTPSWLHQEKAYEFLDAHRGGILGIHMGGGKSKVTVDYVVSHNLQRVIVAAPKSVVGVWPKQFAIHGASPYPVYPLTAEKVGSVKDRTDRARHLLNLHRVRREPCVLVVNHESVWREPFARLVLEGGFDGFILDESHRAKQPTGRLGQFMMAVSGRIPHKIALSGTPTPHDECDIFSQARFVRPSVFGYRWTIFKQDYAQLGGYTGTKPVGIRKDKRDEFTQKVSQLLYLVTKEELDLNLPPETHSTRTCALPEEHRKKYDELKDLFYTEIANGTVTAKNAGVKSVRLQQFTSGHLRLDDSTAPIPVSTHKEDLLLDVLADVDEPVVVFCKFIEDLRAIERCAQKHGLRYGEVSGARKDITPDSTMPEDVDVLGVQLRAGGLGIDLTRSSLAIYYSVSYSMEEYEQSLARLARPGQRHPMRFVHLVTENSIDEHVYEVLVERKNIIEVFQREVQQWHAARGHISPSVISLPDATRLTT